MQSMQDTVQVVQAMQAGSKAMATMMKKNKELQVDRIWKTMDGLADLQADFEEIQVGGGLVWWWFGAVGGVGSRVLDLEFSLHSDFFINFIFFNYTA